MEFLNVRITTHLQDFPYIDYEKGDYWVSLNDPYCKEVYRRQYKMNSGFIYGGISFVINGEEYTKILSTDDLHDGWLSLMNYYRYETFNYKQKFLFHMGQTSHYLINNEDKNNPQVRLQFYEKSTEWIPVSVMKQAILEGFLDFMRIIEHDVIDDLYDEDGDPFEFPPELKSLLEIYESLV